MKILSLSDKVLESIYNPTVAQRFNDVDLVLGCGDLPYYYLEYLVDTLGVPVFYVRGNHAVPVEYSERGDRSHPWGAVDLDGKVVRHNGLLIAGFEGSVRYRRGPLYVYAGRDVVAGVRQATASVVESAGLWSRPGYPGYARAATRGG